MPNTYFSFKQFTIQQERAAMKVCTDSCLFGAWVAEKLIQCTGNILDIGAGTGLLSLMLAQKNDACIDAVEIDDESATQARENFSSSPWSGRLTLLHSPIENLPVDRKYDIIISNPPFYEDYLISPDVKRNVAMHEGGLTYYSLAVAMDTRLCEYGKAYIIVPFERMDAFVAAIGGTFFINEQILVKQSPAHRYFRAFMELSRKQTTTINNTITITDEKGNYTGNFKSLLKDYYLAL